MAHHHSHKRTIFTSNVSDPDFVFTDEPREIPPNEIQFAVEIRYKLHRVLATVPLDEASKNKILEHGEERREATKSSSLGDLGRFESCLAVVSEELERIGVRRAKHRGIAKKIANIARAAEFAIRKSEEDYDDDNNNEGEGGFVVGGVIGVEILRVKFRRLCEVCLREKERKQAIINVLHLNHNHDGDDDDDDDDEKCAICMEEFDGDHKGRRVRVPCAWLHKFHAKCIFKWLMKSSTCPLCRFHIPI